MFNTVKTRIQNLLIPLAILATVHQAIAQGTAFTYQGRLNVGTNQANGSYDLTFALFGASSGAGQVGQARIFAGARTGLGLAVDPVVIAAGRDFQGFAEPANGMLGFHRFNPLKPLDGGSERMPKVFFKMSRCCRR